MEPEILQKGQKITQAHYEGVTRHAYGMVRADGGSVSNEGNGVIRTKTGGINVFVLKEDAKRNTISGDDELYCSAKARRITYDKTDQTKKEGADESEYRILFPATGTRRTARRKRGEVVIAHYIPRFSSWVAETNYDEADIWLKNTTGSTIAPGFVGFSTPVVTSSFDKDLFLADETFLAVATPTLSHRYGQWAYIDAEIPNNGIGPGQRYGILSVQVNIRHTGDTYADIDPADRTRLRSSSWGWAKILWKESGTGLKWCKLDLSQHEDTFKAKSTAVINPDTSHSARLWKNKTTDLGYNDDVVYGWMSGTETIPSGASLICRWNDNNREAEIIEATC